MERIINTVRVHRCMFSDPVHYGSIESNGSKKFAVVCYLYYQANS